MGPLFNLGNLVMVKEIFGFIGLVLLGMVAIAALTTDPVSIEQLVEIHMGIWK